MGLDELKRLKDIETEGGYSAKVSGDTGELNLANAIRSLPEEYHTMNNILLKTKKGTTQIDHILVSPYGIFIVETKNHKGMIFGDCYGQVWTQVLNGRGHFRLYSPVLQNAGHINQLSKSIKISTNFMQGIIVFTNPDANLDNVNCPFCFRPESLVEYVMQFRNPIFTENQVFSLIKRIDKVNISSYMNDRAHVEYVKGIKERRGY